MRDPYQLLIEINRREKEVERREAMLDYREKELDARQSVILARLDDDRATLKELHRVIKQAFMLVSFSGLPADFSSMIAPDPAESFYDDALKQAVEIACQGLTDAQRKVLFMRFGFGGDNPMTLREIGERINLTPERVRQIQLMALRKLRHPSTRRILKVFL